MSVSRNGRSLWGAVLRNFINSLKPRRITGSFMGQDYFGNKYYEIPADPSRGKRNPQRWVIPPDKIVINQEKMVPEWDSWLRLRRVEPPSDQEIHENLSLANLKKENASKLESKETRLTDNSKKQHPDIQFPTYEEYEVNPGQRKKEVR